jgi:hypothetical protein
LFNPSFYILVVGDKVDRETERKVSGRLAEDFAVSHQFEYLETSALTRSNVMETFAKLAAEIARRVAAGHVQECGAPGKCSLVPVDPGSEQ